jgi:chromosomal replication initiation ATPase DnaA
MHLIRTHMSKSYPAIGRLFNRDHTSVLHAVRKVERQRDSANIDRIFVVDGRRGAKP